MIRKAFIAIALGSAMLGCGGAVKGVQAPRRLEPPKRILIEHEKVYIEKLAGLETLAGIDGWPEGKGEVKALLERILGLRQLLINEFRRCEKYGLYTVVDTLRAPTVFITPRLGFKKVSNDTLYMPLYLDVRNRASGSKSTLEVDAVGIFDPRYDDGSRLYAIGEALADYRREFPYVQAVKVFYPPLLEEKKKRR